MDRETLNHHTSIAILEIIREGEGALVLGASVLGGVCPRGRLSRGHMSGGQVSGGGASVLQPSETGTLT